MGRFLNWLFGEKDESPPQVPEIKKGVPEVKEEVITQEDLDKILNPETQLVIKSLQDHPDIWECEFDFNPNNWSAPDMKVKALLQTKSGFVKIALQVRNEEWRLSTGRPPFDSRLVYSASFQTPMKIHLPEGDSKRVFDEALKLVTDREPIRKKDFVEHLEEILDTEAADPQLSLKLEFK